jgi:hypothetical protein
VSGLFIARRAAIPHDGSRRVITDGRIERPGNAPQDDDDLMAEVAAALSPVPEGAVDAGLRAWEIHQRREDPE